MKNAQKPRPRPRKSIGHHGTYNFRVLMQWQLRHILCRVRKNHYLCDMITDDKYQRLEIKRTLLGQLKQEHAFWSYEPESVNVDSIEDDQLIALTMRYLDLPEINQLFKIYSGPKIKNVWKRLLVPEGEYLYTLNRFFAWYYFEAKSPDTYLKSLQTRHINKLLGKRCNY